MTLIWISHNYGKQYNIQQYNISQFLVFMLIESVPLTSRSQFQFSREMSDITVLCVAPSLWHHSFMCTTKSMTSQFYGSVWGPWHLNKGDGHQNSINIAEMEMSSGWLPCSSMEKLAFNVPSDNQECHPDDISVSVMLWDSFKAEVPGWSLVWTLQWSITDNTAKSTYAIWYYRMI